MYHPDGTHFDRLSYFAWRRLRVDPLTGTVGVSYREVARRGERLVFGWLDPAHECTRGHCPARVVEILEDAARSPICQTRGYHQCGFCAQTTTGLTRHQARSGETVLAGSACIEIQDLEGNWWVAPNMVLHHIAEHSYLPPERLIDGLARRAGNR
jgi:hypothetical protein